MTTRAGRRAAAGFRLPVAGVCLDVVCTHPDLGRRLRRQMGAFALDLGTALPPATLVVPVHLANPDDQEWAPVGAGSSTGRADPVGPCGEPDVRPDADAAADRTWPLETPVYRVAAGRREVIGLASRGVVDVRGGATALVIDGSADLADLEAEYFLRVVMALSCFAAGGLLLHAAAAVRAGTGYLFVGPSGAGKTTAARHAVTGAHFIQDDLVVVRPWDGGWAVHAVPFTGPAQQIGTPVPATARVSVIALLAHATSAAWRPLPAAEAVAAIAAIAPIVNSDPELAAQLLARVASLVGDLPVGELRLAPDPSYWEVLP